MTSCPASHAHSRVKQLLQSKTDLKIIPYRKLIAFSDVIKDTGWQDALEVRTLTSKLSSLGLNLGSTINCHCGVSQAG